MTHPVNYGTISANELVLNKNELASRLCIPRGYSADFAQSCDEQVRKVMDVKYCYGVFPVVTSKNNTVDMGFGTLTSENLRKNLEGCDRAYVFALTLGISVDRLIARLTVSSAAEGFIADGIASAYAEAAADKLSERLSENQRLKPRFSPGYGDLPLSVQPEVLCAINASKLTGITVNKSYLMTPFKSVTAIQGILD